VTGPVVRVSPDGRWLAYVSNVSGHIELYVRPYPGPGQAEQVSLEGGSSPAWHPSGGELFFVSGPDAAGEMVLMVVDIGPGSPVSFNPSQGGRAVGRARIGRPRPLFPLGQGLSFASIPVRSYDVAPDGRHFYAIQYNPPPPAPPITHVSLVLNWSQELVSKVPAARD